MTADYTIAIETAIQSTAKKLVTYRGRVTDEQLDALVLGSVLGLWSAYDARHPCVIEDAGRGAQRELESAEQPETEAVETDEQAADDGSFTVTRDGVEVTVRPVRAAIEDALVVDGYLLRDGRGAYAFAFEREAADAIMASNNLHEEDWETEHTEYDAATDTYILSKDGEVVEYDEGEDWGDLHLYFIGCELDYVWSVVEAEDE